MRTKYTAVIVKFCEACDGMVCFLQSPYWSKRLMLLPFADRLPADVGRPRFASPNRPIVAAFSSGAAARDPGLATPAPRPPTITASATSSDSSRPVVVGLAVEGLDALAIGGHHRQA